MSICIDGWHKNLTVIDGDQMFCDLSAHGNIIVIKGVFGVGGWQLGL